MIFIAIIHHSNILRYLEESIVKDTKKIYISRVKKPYFLSNEEFI